MPTQPFGTLSAAGELRLERRLKAPIGQVWRFLTDPAKRAQWLCGGTAPQQAGGTMQYVFRNTELSPHREEVPAKYAEFAQDGCGFQATVLQCEPPRLLSHTWGEEGDSEVRFELSAAGDDTLLVITHRKLADKPDQLLSVSAGWHAHTAILEAVMAGEIPPPLWSNLMQLEEEYSARFGLLP